MIKVINSAEPEDFFMVDDDDVIGIWSNQKTGREHFSIINFMCYNEKWFEFCYANNTCDAFKFGEDEEYDIAESILDEDTNWDDYIKERGLVKIK